MSDAIEAVKAKLESARHALQGAEEQYAKDERAARSAADRSGRSYDARARNARNVERLERALEILEARDE